MQSVGLILYLNSMEIMVPIVLMEPKELTTQLIIKIRHHCHIITYHHTEHCEMDPTKECMKLIVTITTMITITMTSIMSIRIEVVILHHIHIRIVIVAAIAIVDAAAVATVIMDIMSINAIITKNVLDQRVQEGIWDARVREAILVLQDQQDKQDQQDRLDPKEIKEIKETEAR